MAVETTLNDIFEFAISSEKTAQELYSILEMKFSSKPDLVEIWQKLKTDEEQHWNVLVKIRDSLTEEQLRTDADPSLIKRIDNIRDIPVEKRLAAIKNLNDAYELAHELEYSEINFIFQFLVNQYIPKEDRKEFVLKEINEHLATLQVIKDKYPDVKTRCEIICEE